MKKILSILFVFITCILLCACSKNNQVYVYGTAQEPGSMNPDAVDEPYGFSIYQNIFSRLVKYTNSFEIVSDIAKSWEFTNEGKKLTFKLYENIKWHDGEEFTSEDVKWTFDTIIEKNGLSASGLKNVESIKCPDKNTVVFNFSTADASILSTLSTYGAFIMPKHIYEGTDWLENKANQKPIGTGPYKFSEWKSGESVTLVKNENYFGEEPKLEKVIFKFIPDENTAWLSWLNDEIDWYDSYPSEEVEKLKNNKDYKVLERLTANVTYLTFNTKKAPFKDKAVREAIAYAVDREELLSIAYKNVGKISEYAIPSTFQNYLNENAKLPMTNVKKAKKILEDAGYKKNKKGYYLTIDFEYFDLDNYIELAEVLKKQLAEVGIKLNLKLIEYTTWQEKIINNKDFTMTLMNGNQGPVIYGTIKRFDPNSSLNITGYKNSKLTKYIDNIKASSNDEELKDNFHKVQEILTTDFQTLNLIEKVEYLPLKSKILGHPYDDAKSIASPDELTYTYFK